MTLQLRTLVDDRAPLTGVADRMNPTPASPEAIRLALRLRDCPAPQRSRVLLFVPATRNTSVARVVGHAIRGLLHLGERPVLVMDLRAGTPATGEELHIPSIHPEHPHDDFASDWPAPIVPAAFIQPFTGRGDAVAYAASAEFANAIAQARTRYDYVLAVGDPIGTSVQTLMAASQCDGIVLSVDPGRSTRRDVQQTAEQLRRARAQVLGFVLDGRESGRDA